MAVPPKLRPALKALVHEIVIGNFVELEADKRIGRLTVEELRQAIADYGRTLIDLPDESFRVSESYAISGQKDAWSIDLALWTLEEGRSDLTLTVSAEIINNDVKLEIDDLHVL